MQHWSKLDCHEGEPCPVRRCSHKTVCLGYNDRPQLLVTGGMGPGNKVLSDLWLLDVESERWREVSVCILWWCLSAVMGCQNPTLHAQFFALYCTKHMLPVIQK